MSYKKVITTEETFEYDYPPAAPNGQMLTMMPPRMPMPGPGMPPGMIPPPPFPGWGNVGNTMPNTSPTLTSIFSNIQPEDTKAGVALRLQFRNVMTKIGWLLRSFAVSELNGNEDRDFIQTNYTADMQPLTSLVSDYYGTRLDVNTGFSNFVKSIMTVVTAKKTGTGVAEAMTALQTSTSQLAGVLLSLVSGPISGTTSISDMEAVLSAVTGSIMDQVNSITTKNWTADHDALSKMYELMVTGRPNGETSLADILTKITVNAAPSRFPV